jgi:hypothetical protein
MRWLITRRVEHTHWNDGASVLLPSRMDRRVIVGGLYSVLTVKGDRAVGKLGGMRPQVTRLVWIGALALALAGCATSTALSRAEKPRPLTPGASILLMEPDVELYEVTAGGLLEPKADWTAAAHDNVTVALSKAFEAKRVTVVPYTTPSDPSLEQTHVQLTKLHERVGSTIITFRYGPALRLPGKGEVFDWTLGKEAKTLAGNTGAEYALFIRFLDSYASGGRVAMITVFALLGVGLPGGTQVGFASLVDLRTGDLVWFNRLVNPAGDLRTPERAREAVQALLADLPV